MVLAIRDPEFKQIALDCVKEYEKNSAAYIQEVVKNALASFYSAILNAEFLAHLGYEKSSSALKDNANRRNGFVHKKVRSSFGDLDVLVPRDRDGSFNPIAVRKHSRAVTSSESKILTIFARGMSEDDIMVTLSNMYGYELPTEKVQIVKKQVMNSLADFEHRHLKSHYAFVLIAKIDFSVKNVRSNVDTDMSLYVIEGVDQMGSREILDLYISPPGPRSNCITLLDRLKKRGVTDIVVLLSEGLPARERDVHILFPHTTLY